MELWLCSLEPRNVLDRYGKWLHGVKQCAERLCRLHVIPQMMEVFNRHGPILSDSNWGSQMAGISKKTNERLGSNLSVLVSIICFSCARSMWFKQCTTCELDEDKVKSDVSFSHLENVMETSFCGTRGSRSLKANKFDSLCPVFECNGTKFSSLSDLVSHLLEVSSGFDAMVKQFPVEDVLDFLEGNKLMKLEKLVGKWVLDKDSSENVVAANLDLCEAQDVDDTLESTSGPPEDTETPSSTAADTQTTEQSTQQPNSSASQAIVEIDGTDKEEENGEADDGIGDETTASLLESYITAEKRKKLDNTSASAQEIQQLAKKRQRSNASGNSSCMLLSRMKVAMVYHQNAREFHTDQESRLEKAIALLQVEIKAVEAARKDDQDYGKAQKKRKSLSTTCSGHNKENSNPIDPPPLDHNSFFCLQARELNKE